MVRYMLHLVNQGYTPQNAKQLLGDARQMCSRMDIIIRDCRVSVKCVEFDISLNTKTTDDRVTDKFDKKICKKRQNWNASWSRCSCKNS